MAVWKMPDGKRKLPWRAKVKGRVKNFLTQRDALFWERSQLQSYTLTGLPLTVEVLQKATVGEIVERYLGEKTPLKGSAASEKLVLKRFLRQPICKLSLASVKRTDGYSYRNERLRATWKGKAIAESSVKREVSILHNIFEVAKDEWGYENLSNPFDKMKLKDGHGRERRLKRGELERLEQAAKECRGLNRYYIPLAIYLAIETGMRLQEIFNLLWSDIDMIGRRIVIRKSKTDHVSQLKGRTIVLTVTAMWYLARLALLGFGPVEKVIKNKRGIKANEAYWEAIASNNKRVFPMTKEAFKQSWRDTKLRAGMKDLQFRDLRHEAGSRFDEADLSRAEHGLMLGHGKRTMDKRYIHSELKSIEKKLDKYALDGLTLDESIARAIAEGSRHADGSMTIKGSFSKGVIQDIRALMTGGGLPQRVDVIQFEETGA
jgi:integrase